MSPEMGTIGPVDVNNLIAVHAALRTDIHGRIIARKSVDQTLTQSSAALQDVTGMLFAVAANEVWEFNCPLRINSIADADMRVSFSVPAGATVSFHSVGDPTSGTFGIYDLKAAGGSQRLNTDSVGYGNQGAILSGIYVGDATAGNVQLQAAQWTADASDTKVLANSCIIAHRLA